MSNVWSRVFFKSLLGWLFFWFLRVLKTPRHWPLYGLLFGLVAAVVHPKPSLAWFGAMALTLMLTRVICFQSSGLKNFHMINAVPFALMLALFALPLLAWGVFGARLLDNPDFMSPELWNAVKQKRLHSVWYIWDVLPEFFSSVRMGFSMWVSFGIIAAWAVFAQVVYRRYFKPDELVQTVNVCCICFFTLITVVPILEYVITLIFGWPPQLAALTVNFDSLRFWLLTLGAAGVAFWLDRRRAAPSVASRLRRWPGRFSCRLVAVTVVLLVASVNFDRQTWRSWLTPSIKSHIMRLVISQAWPERVQAFFRRYAHLDRIRKRLEENKLFLAALDAARDTPEGSLFYCYKGGNYVRVAALRPVVFSFDDEQKCVVSPATFDKLIPALKFKAFLHNTPPESMNFKDALDVYRRMGAEYVFDRRAWPKDPDQKGYTLVYSNRVWSIIRIHNPQPPRPYGPDTSAPNMNIETSNKKS
jgi:hypothetical protein